MAKENKPKKTYALSNWKQQPRNPGDYGYELYPVSSDDETLVSRDSIGSLRMNSTGYYRRAGGLHRVNRRNIED